MGTNKQLQGFVRTNAVACKFAWKAHEDYLYVRCGMLQGMWSSFEMATQATEKLLKSFLLFRTNVTPKFIHDVEKLLGEAARAGLQAKPDLPPRINRINDYYHRRYPDEGGPKSISTSEIDDVDAAIFEIWDNFKGVDPDYYYTSGILTPAYGFLLHGPDRNFSTLTVANKAFAARQASIEAGIKKLIATWYPATVVPDSATTD